MLNYSYPLFRPPAEEHSIIIQVTLGCSYNHCSFCSMYSTKKYTIRNLKDIYTDIDHLALNYPDATKIFLADGDALALDTNILLEILKYLQNSFLSLRRVSAYGSTQNLLMKSKEQLDLLQKNKLTLIYYGIESGSPIVLKKINKGVTKEEIITSLNMLSNSNIKISSTVILGIGGKKYSKEHISFTADIINNTTVTFLATLQLGLDEAIKEKFYKYFPDFEPIDDNTALEEQKQFLEQINAKNKIIFRSNHASNAFHLAGNLPKDKFRLISEIDSALQCGNDSFIPKMFRGF